jgi:hypothetical protein
MSDKTILEHITELVHEEQRLRNEGAAAVDPTLVRAIEQELDQCWDLLRQRRARREFGEDPEQAEVRDPQTVENYRG